MEINRRSEQTATIVQCNPSGNLAGCSASSSPLTKHDALSTTHSLTSRQLPAQTASRTRTPTQLSLSGGNVRRQELITNGGQTPMQRWIMEKAKQQPWSVYRREWLHMTTRMKIEFRHCQVQLIEHEIYHWLNTCNVSLLHNNDIDWRYIKKKFCRSEIVPCD